MALLLVAAPAAEPLTLAEAKSWLRIDTTDDDALVGALIETARLLVETASGRVLMSQTWRWVLDAWPAESVFRIPVSPLQGVPAIRVYNTANVATTLDPASYRLDAVSDPPRLALLAGVAAPSRTVNGIEIDLAAGYGAATDVPEPLRQAVRLVLADLYETRGDPADPERMDRLSVSAAALIAPFKRRRL